MPMFIQGLAGMLRRMSDGGVNYSSLKLEGISGALSAVGDRPEQLHPLGRGGPGPGSDAVHHQFLLQHQAGRGSRRATTRGKPRPWSGRRRRRRRTAISSSRRRSIAVPMNTACPATTRTTCRRISHRLTAHECCARSRFTIHDLNGHPLHSQPRPDTGVYNAKVGMWLFLASEVMLFGGLFSSYILLRVAARPGTWPHGWLSVPLGTLNTAHPGPLGDHHPPGLGRLQGPNVRPLQGLSGHHPRAGRWSSSASKATNTATSSPITKWR